MTPSDLSAAAAALGSLSDDLRLGMYLFIRRQGRPVSRDEAAGQVGISRKLAAFHLDKLESRGLLRAHYARPPGRTGPGAGRTSKLYTPSDVELVVSLPPRAYDFVGSILVEAIEQAAPGESARASALRVARARGMELGEEMRLAARSAARVAERAPAGAEAALSDLGYEPLRNEEGGLELRNCPFHALARQSPALVCGLNQAFVAGLLTGLGNDSVRASLEPRAGRCCVHLRPDDSEATTMRADGNTDRFTPPDPTS